MIASTRSKQLINSIRISQPAFTL